VKDNNKRGNSIDNSSEDNAEIPEDDIVKFYVKIDELN
jgi:hypothetical protein